MTDTHRLVVEIRPTGVQEAARQLRDLEKQGGRTEKSTTAMAAAFQRYAGLISGGAIAAGIGQIIRSTANSADALAKLSARTGETVENLSRLQYAASLNDVSNDQLSNGLQRLAKAMSDTAADTGESRAAFDAMGISVKDVSGKLKSSGEVFREIADKFSRYEDSATKAALAQRIFGESGANLIPLLNAGSKGLADMADESDRFGRTMTTEAAKAAEQFNDNLTRMGSILEGLRNEIGNATIPAIARLSQEFLDARASGLSFMEALTGIGLSDPTKGPAEQITRLTAELDKLKDGAWYEQSVFGLLAKDDVIAQKTKELEYWRKQLLAVQGLDPRDRMAGSRLTAPTLQPRTAAARTAARTAARIKSPAEDLNAGQDTEAARAYGSAIQAVAAAHLEAEKSGLQLSAAQSVLYDLMRSPEWARMPEEWRQIVVEQTAAATATNGVAEAQKRLNDLIAATPTSRLEEQRETMSFLAQAYRDGKLGAVGSAEAIQKYGEAANEYLGNVEGAAQRAADGMSEFAKNFASATQSSLSDLLFKGATEGFDGIANDFGRMLQRLAADAAAAKLMENLFGASFGETGTVDAGSWIGSAMKWLASADGNAFAGSGAVQAFAAGGAFGNGEILTRPTAFRFAQGGAFRNGIAGEAGPEGALPLKRMANGKLGVYADGGGSGGGLSVTQNITVQGGGGAPDVRRAAGQGAREGLSAIAGMQRYQ